MSDSEALHPAVQRSLDKGNLGLNPDISDNLREHINFIETLLNGGTEELGLKIGTAVVDLARNGEMRYCLIFEGEKDRGNVVAKDIPTNIGLLKAFGMDPKELDSLRGYNTVRLGNTGLTAFMQPVWEPSRDLTEAETNGFKKRLTNGDGTKAESGYIFIPQVALRAVFEDVIVTDPELPFMLSQVRQNPTE